MRFKVKYTCALEFEAKDKDDAYKIAPEVILSQAQFLCYDGPREGYDRLLVKRVRDQGEERHR